VQFRTKPELGRDQSEVLDVWDPLGAIFLTPGRFELLQRPLLQTLRALVTSAAWRDALELLRGAAAQRWPQQLGSEVLSR